MKYRKGYKYQLAENFTMILPFSPLEDIDAQFIVFKQDRYLTIRSGYAWDGPSGPTIDTKNFMTPALVHDVLYQLIRKKFLPSHFRAEADSLLKEMCLERKMSSIRAWYVHRGVSRHAEFAADPRNVKKVYVVD